ncbi:MAG: EAL domain-containing protein [Ilumatobacteraceae bacterium]|nr:EAL domain-containing protein [Ilumatobacteraceae bacterium]
MDPSRATAIRYGLVGLALILMTTFVEVAVHGLDVESWGSISGSALMLLPAWAGVTSLARYRSDRQREWLFLAIGSFGWAFGQLLWLAQITLNGSTTWPSFSDIGYLVWPIAVIGAVVIHTRPFERSTRVVFMVDALVLAVALSFIAWEVIIRAGVGDPARFSLPAQLAMLIYPLTDIALASMLGLLLLIGHSPARIGLFVGAVLLTIADTAYSASVGTTTNTSSFAVSWPCWVLAFAVIALAAGLPSGGVVRYTRPTLSRLLVVHLPVMVAVWLAAWRYMLRDTSPTTVTIVIGVLAGLLIIAEQLATWNHSTTLSDRLSDNITNLRRTEAELRALLDDLPDSVIVLDGEGRILEANKLVLEITGRSHSEVLNKTFASLVRPGDRALLLDVWEKLRSRIPVNSPVFPFDHPDGREILLEADVHVPIRDPERVVVTLRDITGRLREAQDLDLAQARFRAAFHGAPTGMALSSADDGTLIDVNESLATMLGYTRIELVGRGMQSITHPDDWKRLPTHTAGIAADSYHMEQRYIRNDQSVMWARAWVSVMDDGDGHRLAITHIEDITEQRHSAERLEWAATHDELTRLPNRFRFLDQLARFLETSEPGAVAVMFIDLDNFKVINDSLGHGVGDELLRGMSERLRAVVRDRDMLSRFGGDEFIVMLCDIGATVSPVEIAERLRAEIAQPLIVDGAELFVTASIGIAVADRAGVSTTELLRDADAAMYRAKARGRDCVEVFSPGTHDATVLTLRTTNELRRGLERGEIVPYYQPIVQLDSGLLVGFEVLARWRHPDRGLLGPDQFLPMAEETGLIGEVGAAVLRSSLSQLGQWRIRLPRFANLTVSVNVSGRQLMSSVFHGMVAEALAESGLTADALWLEITESALMSDVKAATVALRELRNLGLHLAVDDFGTGYSSLTYLKRFPVEAIKVDRSFVSGLGIDPEDTTIVEAVVKLGHSLGLLVVAEGVETPLQLARLREIGCDHGQGYVFGRPRPADLVETEYALA